ncbi:hypothetical protein JHW33_12160 [Rahnella aceris]|uniref:hypothetical protein n=1 Tax=Rahnella sp. (strain Y9602) TaxID=2703885 RepID=UPI001907C368|nr:hypothetical protein [Rahnella aceris]QQN33232.1 hypothetical protein JHW33_12160 [Rahnella aceris]
MKRMFLLIIFPFFSISQEMRHELHVDTFGNFSNAAGQSLIINNKDALTQVSGYKNDKGQAKYLNRDHVGLYIGMYGPTEQIITAADEVSYSKNGFFLPIKYPLSKIKNGMFVTTSPKRYSAKIISVDYDKRFVVVSGWYANGNVSSDQIPDFGSTLIINSADKIWGQNTNVFVSKNSSAKTATGYELGMISDGSHDTPIWGFHAVNISNVGLPFDQAFRATGRWVTAFYSGPKIDNAFFADEPVHAALNVINNNNKNWSGTAVSIDSIYANKKSYIIKSTQNGVNKFYLKSDGTKSNNRLEVFKTAKSVSLSKYGPSIILCKNLKDIKITLPHDEDMRGISFEIKSINGAKVTVDGLRRIVVLNSQNGTYAKFIHDGDEWIELQQSN